MSMSTKMLIVPIVHLNGSSRASLVEGYCNAGVAVSEALKLLGETCPNGRDYYIADSVQRERFKLAQAQHEERVARLRSVLRELGALADAVEDSEQTVGVEQS